MKGKSLAFTPSRSPDDLPKYLQADFRRFQAEMTNRSVNAMDYEEVRSKIELIVSMYDKVAQLLGALDAAPRRR